MSLAHSRVKMDGANALPLLLEKGSNVVAANHNVLEDLVWSHLNVGNSEAEGDGLLQPEFGGLENFINSSSDLITSTDWSREFTSTVERRAESLVEVLDDTFGSKEEVVLLSPVLDGLLILVEVSKGSKIVAWDLESGSFFAVNLITHDTNTEAWADNVWKLDGTNETLILSDVVTLKTDLKFDSFSETPLLGGVSIFKDFLNRTLQGLLNMLTPPRRGVSLKPLFLVVLAYSRIS